MLEQRWVLSIPTNPHDPLCIAAWVPGIPGERGTGARPCMLGHVAKEAARWLSPLLGTNSTGHKVLTAVNYA